MGCNPEDYDRLAFREKTLSKFDRLVDDIKSLALRVGQDFPDVLRGLYLAKDHILDAKTAMKKEPLP